MKTCTKCGVQKPLDEFSKNGRFKRAQCKTCCAAITRKWNKENPEKSKEQGRAWRLANPDRKRELDAEWHKNNPCKDRRRINNQNRRARKREVGGRLSQGLAERLFKLQRGKCACGCKQPLGDDYHRDHIMPLALGGSNTDDNIQLLRATCNLQKRAKHPVDFMQQKGFLL